MSYSFFRYWDAVAKQQQLQRKAEEESHRQQWVAYFEGQATAGTAVIGEQSGEQELDDAQHSESARRATMRQRSRARGGPRRDRDREREEGHDETEIESAKRAATRKNNESAEEGCDKIEAGGHNGTCENRGAQRDYTSAKGGTRDREREEGHDETEIESAEEGCDKIKSEGNTGRIHGLRARLGF